MRNIILTEAQVKRVINELINEQAVTPVIDFNKLPNNLNLNDNRSDEGLFNAGFPRTIKDPIRNNMNVLRYYDRVDSDGMTSYKKKLKPPTPNYVVTSQEKTVPKGKYDNGFLGKFGCVVKQGWRDLDENKDGIVDVISRGSTNEEVRYYPNGKLKIFRGKPNPKPHWEDSTWSCSGDKVVDKFLKNTSFKPYKGDNPWVNQGGLTRIPVNTTDNGSGGKVISGIQQKLIDLGLLKISRPTGNYGTMTKMAVLDYAAKNNRAQYTNQENGITKDVYDQLMLTTKTFGK
jgi:hypothetical protein